jgi:hypothetical protein
MRKKHQFSQNTHSLLRVRVPNIAAYIPPIFSTTAPSLSMLCKPSLTNFLVMVVI